MWTRDQARHAAVSLDPAWEFDVKGVMEQANCDFFSATHQLLESLDVAAAVEALSKRPHPGMNEQDQEILLLRQTLLQMREQQTIDERRLEIDYESLRLQLEQFEAELARQREFAVSHNANEPIAPSLTSEYLEREIATLKLEIDREEQSAGYLRGEIDAVKKEMISLETYTTELESDVSSLRAAVSRAKARADSLRLQQIVENVQDVLHDVHSDSFVSLQSEHQRLLSQIAQRADRVKQLLSRRSLLKDELEEITRPPPSDQLSNPAGIGIFVSSDGIRAIVSSVMIGGPAYTRGISVGDRISEVDGVPTLGMSAAEISARIRGPEGSFVVLKMQPIELQEMLDGELQRAAERRRKREERGTTSGRGGGGSSGRGGRGGGGGAPSPSPSSPSGRSASSFSRASSPSRERGPEEDGLAGEDDEDDEEKILARSTVNVVLVRSHNDVSNKAGGGDQVGFPLPQASLSPTHVPSSPSASSLRGNGRGVSVALKVASGRGGDDQQTSLTTATSPARSLFAAAERNRLLANSSPSNRRLNGTTFTRNQQHQQQQENGRNGDFSPSLSNER